MLRVSATPDFVPHEKWDEHAWTLPPRRGSEPWYYAVKMRRRPSRRELPRDRSFLQTVDEPLRELVQMLHSKGIATGPSCSGHELREGEFSDIWRGLRRDAERVRGEGLVLRDPETGSRVLFRDPEYHVPWPWLDDFLEKARAHQAVGWLPFYTRSPAMAFFVGPYEGFEIVRPRSDTYAVRTSTPSEETWERATKTVAAAL